MGDDVQAIKAGIMEIGDVFVINKADREGVFATEKSSGLAFPGSAWRCPHPPIVKTIATESQGIEELAAAIASFKESQLDSGVQDRQKSIARWRIPRAAARTVACARFRPARHIRRLESVGRRGCKSTL